MPTFADVDDLPDPFGAEEEYLVDEEEPPFEPYDETHEEGQKCGQRTD